MSKPEETPQAAVANDKAAVESHEEATVSPAEAEVTEGTPVDDQDVTPVDETPEDEGIEPTTSPVADDATPVDEAESHVREEPLNSEGDEVNPEYVEGPEAYDANLPEGYALPSEGYEPVTESSEVKDQRPVRYALIGLAVGVFVGFCCNFAVTGVQDLIKSSSATAITVAVSDCNLDGRDGISVSDSNKRLSIDTKGSADESGASTQNAVCLVQALQVPENVLSKLNETKPDDGQTHKEEWDKHEITWEFSADKGIKMDILIKS